MRLISHDEPGHGTRLGVEAPEHAMAAAALVPAGPRTIEELFVVARIISHCSQAFTLEPGDVIATGTPAGVGVFRKPPRFLGDGDRVTISIEGIGDLVNVCRLDGPAVDD